MYYDYGDPQGTLLMDIDVYRATWDDPGVTALAVNLVPGADPDALTRDFQDGLIPIQQLLIQPNRSQMVELPEAAKTRLDEASDGGGPRQLFPYGPRRRQDGRLR